MRKTNTALFSVAATMMTDHYEMPAALEPITDQEFGLFQKLIYGEAGIHLAPYKKALLEARLSKHIRELGLGSFAAYYKYVVKEKRDDELIRMLDFVSTNETHFFREPRHFEYLEDQVFAQWSANAAAGIKAKRIRIWSAGCSTGEEPYSIAMMLLEHFPPDAGWELEILATDLSTRVLKWAQSGIWPIEKSKEIPDKYLKRFMLKGIGSQQGNMKARPEVVSLIHFERLNLNRDTYPATGFFDAIFCRNVMIYFDTQSRTRVIERLLDHLDPSGYLFIGHAESLNGITERARHVMPTIYVRATDENFDRALKSCYREER
jgi:chemotaxis protein methyltransferase CheR